MLAKNRPEWIAWYFAISLCAIVVMGNIVMAFRGLSPDAITLVFLCFLPQCFWFVGRQQQEARQHIASLEARIRQLEAVSA